MLRHEQLCSVSNNAMLSDLVPAAFRCLACGFFARKLPVRINSVQRIAKSTRACAKGNPTVKFSQLLTECADLLPSGATLLDIGAPMAGSWRLPQRVA